MEIKTENYTDYEQKIYITCKYKSRYLIFKKKENCEIIR